MISSLSGHSYEPQFLITKVKRTARNASPPKRTKHQTSQATISKAIKDCTLTVPITCVMCDVQNIETFDYNSLAGLLQHYSPQNGKSHISYMRNRGGKGGPKKTLREFSLTSIRSAPAVPSHAFHIGKGSFPYALKTEKCSSTLLKQGDLITYNRKTTEVFPSSN